MDSVANNDTTLRRATPDDLEECTNLAIDSMCADPQWNYRFPRRIEKHNDHWIHTKKMIQELLENPRLVVNFITVWERGADTINEKAVSLAVWVLPYTSPPPVQPKPCMLLPDLGEPLDFGN
jgi:hypothetical protein